MTSHTDNSGCLAPLLRLLGSKPGSGIRTYERDEDNLLYRVQNNFLSPAELSFFHVLRSTVGDRVVICPKVRLVDILFVVNQRENYAYRGKIAQKHVDFLLCDPKSLKPILAIELDDSSHERADRAER